MAMDTSESEEFDAFFRLQTPRNISWLHWCGANVDDAAEATQDAMTKLYFRWDSDDADKRIDPSKRISWLRVTSKHAWLDIVKKNTRRREVYTDAQVFVREAMDPPGEHQMVVIEAMRGMTLQQRSVLACHMDGLSGAETAEILEISPATVRSHLSTARAQLKVFLSEQQRISTKPRPGPSE